MSAKLFQHRNAPIRWDPIGPPLHDPRDPVVKPKYESLDEDAMAVLDASEALERLADRLGGYRRVIGIAKSLAWIHGEALSDERPLHRCLADGALLPASRICPSCGRDNS